jgi:hypothetical protein
LLFAVFVLFVEIPYRIPIEVLPASLFGARDLGSSPWFANFKDEAGLGDSTGNNHHGIDGSGLEQRSSSLVGTATMDSGLGVVLAGVVSGRNGTTSRFKGRIGRQRRPVERAHRSQEIRARLMHWRDPAKEGKAWRASSRYP